MDFIIQYYPLIKMLTTGVLALIILWFIYKKMYKSAIVVIIMTSLFLLYKPVKLKTNTDEVNQEDNKRIQANRVIPPKIEDNSFEEGNQAIKHITKEELQ